MLVHGSFFIKLEVVPLAASIISLVNDELISCGRPPLGLLNPWLYYKGIKDLQMSSAETLRAVGRLDSQLLRDGVL